MVRKAWVLGMADIEIVDLITRGMQQNFKLVNLFFGEHALDIEIVWLVLTFVELFGKRK